MMKKSVGMVAGRGSNLASGNEGMFEYESGIKKGASEDAP
jgi:hypothetical protein